RVFEAWNKIDLLDAGEREKLANIAARNPPETRPALVSALTGEGIAILLSSIEAHLAAGRALVSLALDPADGASLGWLHRQGEVIDRHLEDGRMQLTVRVDSSRLDQVRRRFPQAILASG